MCIPKSIFKEIRFVSEAEGKYKYIEAVDAIFIDNSFQERLEVNRHTNCPVFDVDGIELLLSEKL
jgi:hypothetical protein